MIEIILGFLIIIMTIILPIHLAGRMVDAKRIGFVWCFLAILLSALFQFIGQSISIYGYILSPFLAALAYSIVMKTTYLKGIGIAIIQFVLTIVIATLLVSFSFASLRHLTFPF